MWVVPYSASRYGPQPARSEWIILGRDESQRSHVYEAAIEEAATKRRLVGDVIDRVFEGSVEKMLIHALEARDVTTDELAEILRLLREREAGK